VFERLVVWSVLTGVLWLAGAALEGDQRLLLWIPALGLDLAAPVAGYWLPGRGCTKTPDYDIDGGHFAERCHLFVIIALGESIVVTGATATEAGLTSTVVLCLVVAFLETAALYWLYFGTAGEHSRAAICASDDPGRLARDAYTYLHLPIVAGIIATAVGAHLVIAEPGDPQHGVGLAMVLGGPALYLLGVNLFQWRMTRKTNTKRLAVAGLLIMLLPLAGQVAALLLGVIVTTLVATLAVWELRAPARNPLPAER
jgi:low temperature requirement protein LtrA